MVEEYNVLLHNHTLYLVPLSSSYNLVGCKWVFHTKYLSDDSINCHNARLVAKGLHQRPGFDYMKTLNLVIKHVTVRFILSLVVSNG